MLSPEAEKLLKNMVNVCRNRSKQMNVTVAGWSFEIENNVGEKTKSLLTELQEENYVTNTIVSSQGKENWSSIIQEKGYKQVPIE